MEEAQRAWRCSGPPTLVPQCCRTPVGCCQAGASCRPRGWPGTVSGGPLLWPPVGHSLRPCGCWDGPVLLQAALGRLEVQLQVTGSGLLVRVSFVCEPIGMSGWGGGGVGL